MKKDRRSKGEQKRVLRAMDRHYKGEEHCCFCPDRGASFVLSHVEAEGLRSCYLCIDCFAIWQMNEAALSLIGRGITNRQEAPIHEGVKLLRINQDHVTFHQLKRAIDFVRIRKWKQELMGYKDILTKILLDQYSGRPELCIQHDNRYNNARIFWKGETDHWCCHMPEDQIRQYQPLILPA